jgi:alkylresorcinol/alkylpyrone synthase
MSDSLAPVIHSVTQTLPEHFAPQEEITAWFKKLWAEKYFNVARLEDIHKNTKVGSRYLSVPLSELERMRNSFAERNNTFIKCATDIGEKAIREALTRAELTPKDVDHIFFVTVTGLATPSIDARLVNRLGLRPDVKRTPIWGLGCVAGAAGLARAADYLRAYPNSTVVLLSVELCVLTYQLTDLSVANVITGGLFGDGASAVVLRGANVARGKGPRIVSSRACFYPESEWVMGWDIVDTGFKIILSPQVPEMVRKHFRGNVDEFLTSQGLDRSKIQHWLLHSGGPKVLQAFESTLELPKNALARTWKSLEEVGNLSSSSVLFVLADMLASGEAKPGDYGLLAAMGPGFCSEMVLLQW